MKVKQIKLDPQTGGLITVKKDGVAVEPQHISIREADEHAANEKLANPEATVTYEVNQVVEAKLYEIDIPDEVPPPPEPQPAPDFIRANVPSAPVDAPVYVFGINTNQSSWQVLWNGIGVAGHPVTIVKVPANASTVPLTVGGYSVPVTANSGRLINITDGQSLKTATQNIQSGDYIVIPEGNWPERYDNNNWNEANFCLFADGTPQLPIAFVSAPGANVIIENTTAYRPNFCFGDNGTSRAASYISVCGFHLKAQQANVSGGGNTADSNHPESGGDNIIIIGNLCEILNTTANTMTGLISVQGDRCKALYNKLVDPVARTIINNNHAIYIQCGADDVEVAFNDLTDLRMGHTIQVHQDGTPMLYTNINIHDNYIHSPSDMDTRGITVSNVDNNSTVFIRGNRLKNLGQQFSGICVYRGMVVVEDNVLENINSGGIVVNGGYGGTRLVTARRNTFTNVSGGRYVAQNGASLLDIDHD